MTSLITNINDAVQSKLITLVRRAGDEIMSQWPGREEGSGSNKELEIMTKEDGSFVTAADLAANEILKAGILELFPGDRIYSEEQPRERPSNMQEAAWIIDPLDGTRSFIDGNDDFSILAARIIGGVPQYGIMYFPARNIFVRAQAGSGAWADNKTLSVSSRKIPNERSIYLRHLELGKKPIFYDRWMDSGMAFLKVAQGEFDGVILKIVSHQEWDLAAPYVVLSQSGAKITDEFGNAIQFHCQPIRYRYFVVSNGVVHDQLLSLIPRT
jgi:3'-phosphoadenosine 5'-phosphosulfate (PAPS) 3'-phosphatase